MFEKSLLLTPSQLAKLAHTTPRTVRWYDHMGLLEPVAVDDRGFRSYAPEQVTDLQLLMLMKTLNIGLKQIKEHGRDRKSLRGMFLKHKDELVRRAKETLSRVKTLEKYYGNLKTSETLVHPVAKRTKPVVLYTICRKGSYDKIKSYIAELCVLISGIPSEARFCTVFVDKEFSPKMSEFLIGVEATKQMRPSPKVRKETIPAMVVLSHKHRGEAGFVTLLWRNLIEYAMKKNFKQNQSLPFFGLEYSMLNKQGIAFELQLPVYTLSASKKT